IWDSYRCGARGGMEVRLRPRARLSFKLLAAGAPVRGAVVVALAPGADRLAAARARPADPAVHVAQRPSAVQGCPHQSMRLDHHGAERGVRERAERGPGRDACGPE